MNTNPDGVSHSIKMDRKATLIGKNAQIECNLVEISNAYAAVVSPRGAKPGTELLLVFEIPALGFFTTLRIDTEVAVRQDTNSSVYLKLKFKNLKPHDIEAIDDFIAYKNRLKEMGTKQKKY